MDSSVGSAGVSGFVFVILVRDVVALIPHLRESLLYGSYRPTSG